MAQITSSETKQLVDNVIEGIQEKKGSNIIVLDMADVENSITNYFIICEGDSDTHVGAIADSVEDYILKKTNEKPFHVEGKKVAQWILIDYLDVIVHVFQRATRSFYNLETLWADAKKTEIPNLF
jgi:ribosome-associated protein